MVFHKIRKEDLEFVSVSGTIVMIKSAAPSVQGLETLTVASLSE